MPGHKGKVFLGPENMDITEVRGADELYHPRGIIRQSEENAAALFGAGRTAYSTEGSSLCIRAMIYLALLEAKRAGRRPLILAGRNAHRTLIHAAALLDAEIEWLFPETYVSPVSCDLTPAGLDRALAALSDPPAAVYVTSPDYLGSMLDIRGLSQVCHRRGTVLLADNAHGAYLKFLPEDRHPMTLGADLCCDSAHKTLPVLTGGAYLHVGKNAPEAFFREADRALALFASTSPSYLILQSLDRCNAYLSGEYPAHLAALARRLDHMKTRLAEHGYTLVGEETAKLTLAPKACGYTGDGLHDLLRERGMECEFSDPDFLTAMATPETEIAHLEALERALLEAPKKRPIADAPPPLFRPRRKLSPRQALLLPARETPVSQAAGHILADAHVSCPPCVPILCCGEEIDENAVDCFRYYGIETVKVTE